MRGPLPDSSSFFLESSGGQARSLLMIGEVALALAQLVPAALLITSLSSLYALEPEFDHEHILTIRMSLG